MRSSSDKHVLSSLTPVFVLFLCPKQKAVCAVPVKDSLLEYDFEGQGSSAGSVGCCSLLESDNDLQFLNDLGPKFKSLAEICSVLTPTSKPFLTRKVAGAVKTTFDIAEPVVKPKIEQNVETKHINIKTEKVMSSANISKSSISTVSTALPSMTLPRSKVTNTSHSCNISQSASLPRQAQTVVLQQQPVYYTTSPVQPMHYIVQPQFQNTVLLADGTHGANFPGLYIVNGPQCPSSGLVISGPQGSPSGRLGSPEIPTSPTSPVSPTLLLPVSPGLSQGSVPVDGWKMIGPNPDGNYMLVKDKSSPGEAEGDPGSSQGTLPRGAILVKEAAPPQGVLGPAAQASVYGVLPGHTVAKKGGAVAVNRNLGQTWVGQPGQMGLGPVSVLRVGVGQPRMGMGMGDAVAVKPEVRQAGIWPAEISQVGIRQVSVNQFQGIPPLEKTADASGIPKACRIDSPKEDKTINVVNSVIAAVTTKTQPPSKEDIMMKNLCKDDSDPAQNMHGNAVEEKKSEAVITYTSEQETTLDDEDPNEVVHNAFKNSEGIQEYQTQRSEKSSTVNLEDIVKSLPGPDALQTSFEQSDAVVEKPGDTMNQVLPNQLSKITEAPTNRFTDVINQTTESNDPQENTEKEAKTPQSEWQENHVPSERFSEEDISMVTEMCSTEAFLPGSDVTDLVNKDKENEEKSTFPQGAEATFTSDHINIVDEQVHDGPEESLGRQEVAPLTEEEVEEEEKPVQLRKVEGPEVWSELQSNEVREDQSGKELEEDVSPAKTIVSNLETNQVIATFDSIQAEEMEEMTTVTSDAHEEVKAEQEQLLDSEVGLGPVGDELSATPNEISTDTVNESEEKSNPDQEAMPELQVDHSEGEKINKSHAKTDIADAEVKASLQTVSTILTNQGEGDQGDPNLITGLPEITTQAQVEDSNVQTISILERHLHTATENSSDHKGEDYDNQQNTMSGSGVDQDQVTADADSLSYGEKEEIIAEEEVSQHSFSISDDQDEDDERQAALSRTSQMDNKFISDDNITDEEKDEDAVEEIVSPVQQKINFSDDKDEESSEEDTSCTNSQLDDTLITDDNINVSEKVDKIVDVVVLPIQQNVSVTDYQDEEIKRQAVSGRCSPLEDQLITDDNINIGEKDEHIQEEATSISNGRHEDIGREDAENVISQVDDQLISEDNIRDRAKEISPVQQTTSISDEDKDSEKEDACHTASQVEDKLISDDSVSDGEKEEKQAPSIQQKRKREDASGPCYQSEDQLRCSNNMHDGEKEEDMMSPLQHNISIPDDQDVASAKEDTSGTNSHIEEDGMKSYQMLEENSQSLETECLTEKDPHLPSQHVEMNHMAATLKETETQETPCEVARYQIRQGIDSSQIGDIILNIPERQDTVGQGFKRGANMEDLDDVVTSPEELRLSRVATGQVSMSSEDTGASGSILPSGQVAEGETTLSHYQNTDVIKTEQSEGEDLILEKGKAEVTFDLEVREGLDYASGQVSRTSYSEIKVVDNTTSSVLEADPGSAETGTGSFIATSDVAEEAGHLGQIESLHMTGEAAGVDPNTVGKAGLIEVVSKASHYMHGAEASDGQVSPVQNQTAISQTSRNKSRKGKKTSNKSPQSPKTPSGKCKQQ